jgi:protein TonB
MPFEHFLTQKKDRPRWRQLTYAVSISLHLAVLMAGGMRSFWHVDEISPRGVVVTFLSGMATPPAPPPPPPPAQKATATRIRAKPTEVARPKKPEEVLQPREQPVEEPPTEEGGAEGEPDGVAAGVENGLAGGVVGAAAVEAPPPPVAPARERAPMMLGPKVGTSQRLSDVNDPRFRPSLPPHLNRPGIIVRGLFKICVSTQGQVSDVKMVSSAEPDVASGWTDVIRLWQYRPFTLDGRPTPFCHPLMLEVQSVR